MFELVGVQYSLLNPFDPLTGLIDTYREQLESAGWKEATHQFWRDEDLCFYDLTQTRTVILFRHEDGTVDDSVHFWKFEWQELPEFVNPNDVQVRRYKLHHSMNDLLWHDYGDRKIVH